MELQPVLKAIGRRSFCTLATTSPRQRPHVAGVLYEAIGPVLYTSTERHSRKGRNLAANPHVAVTIPIRRLPVGPPSTVQFQARAEVLAIDDPHITDLLAAGKLRSLTKHGELELPDACFVRITPTGRIHTYGLGMSIWRLLRDPLSASDHVDLAADQLEQLQRPGTGGRTLRTA
jgi:hypothetical protein